MKGYLLDTDIVVFFFRGQKGIPERLATIRPDKIYISEITIAELEYGNHASGRYEENKSLLDAFIASANIVPFSKAIPLYAKERYRLRKAGQSIEDFDLLIGCSSIAGNLVMVTNNAKHYSRIEGICIENWTKQ